MKRLPRVSREPKMDEPNLDDGDFVTDDVIDEITEKLDQTLCFSSTPDPPKPWAYHVSNVVKTSPKPTWSHLNCTIADDRKYDGALLGLPVVFLTTTTYKGDPPDRSTYPRYEGCCSKEHWRVVVPLNQFITYSMWLMAKTDTQIHVLLLPPNSPWLLFLQANPGNTEPLMDDNPYLKKKDGTFIPNDYSRDKMFVNIELLEPLDLSNAKWYDHVVCTREKAKSVVPPISQDLQHNRLLWLYNHIGEYFYFFFLNRRNQ